MLGLALLCADGTENTVSPREPLLLVCQTGREILTSQGAGELRKQ